MKDEWWLRAAITDDKLVADLLLRLKDSISDNNDNSNNNAASPCSFFIKPLPPSWGLRQPRSKPASSASSAPEKRRETRRSPTTPLSWTGGAYSPSEGYEESSSLSLHPHPPPSDRFRSKISAASDTPTNTSKRPRRKKTFAELKEEESSLLKERTYLKKELATLRITLKEQRSLNENLKRIKLDLQVESGVKSEANSAEPEERNTTLNASSEAASSSASRRVRSEDASEQSCSEQNNATFQDPPIFVLPDLNMAPEEECGIVGMS